MLSTCSKPPGMGHGRDLACKKIGTENLAVNDASYLPLSPHVWLEIPTSRMLPASSLRAVPAVASAGRVKLHQVESLQLQTSHKYCTKSKLKLADSIWFDCLGPLTHWLFTHACMTTKCSSNKSTVKIKNCSNSESLNVVSSFRPSNIENEP